MGKVMIRIAVMGAGGRMGKTLIEAVNESLQVKLAAGIVEPSSSLVGVDLGELAGIGRVAIQVADSLEKVVDDFDLLIDFTTPAVTLANAAFCAANGKAMVVNKIGRAHV